MTYFSFKKNKVTTKCSGGERKWLPLPIPPLDHRTCNEPEGHSLPVDISLPPLHILPQLKQPSPRGELRVTSSQTISVGEKDAVPLSPKMVKVLGADGREEEKMASVWGRSSPPSDSDSSNYALNVSPRRESTSAHVQTPQSPFSNRRGCISSAIVMHFENPSVASDSAHRNAASANRSVTPTNRSVANIIREQESLVLAWRTYRNCDDGNELGSPSPLQFSPSRDWTDISSPGRASPVQDLKCSTPQRSPRNHLMSCQGRSPQESFPKPCKLPSPPRTPVQLDRRSQTCSPKTATVLQDLASRPRSLPSPNHNRESSSYLYRLTPPSSPRQHEHKPAPFAPVASCLNKLTPPTSPRPLKMNPVTHLENQDYMLSPRNSPQRSIISSTHRDFPGNVSPLPRFLQTVPKPPQRWKRGAKIGSGSFGSVFEGWNLDDGTFFAVKVSNGDHIPPEIHQEVAVLSKLRHPNIVQYYGTTTENGSICIFLELVKMGSLQSIMKNFQVFDEVLMSSYTRQILTGLEYLHSMNTIHRDIKCANILVDSDGQVKLADFGLAKQMKESLATSVKGSPYYMAPEVLSPGRNKQPYGLEVDIWSLGCTVLEMADGKPPWSGLQGYAFFFKVTNGELPPIPEHLSDTAKDFITRCLRNNPKDRPTVKELLVHPFVTRAPRTFRASVPARD